MNILKKRIFNKYPNAKIVYGNLTTPKRKDLQVATTHYNDALTISGIEESFIDKVGLFKIKI
jgi:hypothetical protein